MIDVVKRGALIGTAALSLAMLVCLPGCLSGVCRLSGTVYYVRPSIAPEAYAGARIAVKDASGRTVANTWADVEGNFEFGLPPGRYTIVSDRKADQVGFAPVTVVLAKGRNVTVTVQARLP
jgi:hypothetical protein